MLLFFGNKSNGQDRNTFKDILLENYIKQNSLENAKKHLDQKMDSLPLFDFNKQAYYHNRGSQISLIQGDFKKALIEAKNASNILKKNPNSFLWGETFRALCFAYIRNGNLDSALIFAEKLLDFTKSSEDEGMKRAALLAMGNISLQNKSYVNSLEFYSEALRITEKIKDSINLKVDYYNVGLAYSQLKEHEKSNSYLAKAAERAEKERALDLLARAYGSIADNYLDLNDFENQEIFLKKANEIAEKIGNQQLLAMGYSNLTESALRKSNYNQAVTWGKKSLEHLANRPIIQLQAKVDSMLYAAHKGLANYKEALFKLEDYDQKRLTIRNEAQKKRLDELTLQFEVEKKDLLIANQEAVIGEEKAKNQVFVIGIGFLGSIAFFLGYINIKNSKTRKLLFRKEKELDQVVKLRSVVPIPIIKIEDSEEKGLEQGNPRDYTQLFQEILEYIQRNKLYLNPKLNQQSLVSEFGTNRKYLYEAISQNGEDNFRGLINRYRINEAKLQMEELIKNREKVDFAVLAEKVGFNSYATFYRAFKGFTGLTPVEYNKEMLREKKLN